MYDDVDIDEKVAYLNQIGYNYIDKDELYEFMQDGLNNASDLEWVQQMLYGVDLDAEYYGLIDDTCPTCPYSLYDEDIIEAFEADIEIIKAETDFLDKYPEYNEITNNNIR